MPNQKRSIRIRMYNVGFGDAFLLYIPGDHREYRVLVDCGSISAAARPMKDTVQEIIAACTQDGKARIDVVIVTHRHKDHISGFASAGWDQVEVGEVWMPWTEDPKDPEAKRIRDRQLKLAESLRRSLTAKQGVAELDADADPFQGIVLNASVNDDAMATVHRGFKGAAPRRFLPARDGSTRTFRPDALRGVTVHVLGPSREEAVIRDIDPPKGESYLCMAEHERGSAEKSQDPFGPEWWVESGSLPPEWQHLQVRDDDMAAIRGFGDDGSEFLAATLDKAINGTSLVLVFEVGDVRLLFPGDAQWGTWSGILADDEWRELLSRTTFLKVGHHGSHNASPKSFIEGVMPERAAAMMSTKKIANWPRIPRQPLVDRLIDKKTKLARSDTEDVTDQETFVVHHDDYIEARIPVKL